MKKQFLILLFWFLALIMVILYARFAYGEIMEDRPTDENEITYNPDSAYIIDVVNDTITEIKEGPCGNHCWVDMRGRNLKEWKLEDHIKPTPAPKVVPKPVPKPVQAVVPKEKAFDLDKFAIAVSHAETGGCKKGAAISHKNCFGLMYWDKNRVRHLRKFNTHEESFVAFKELWRTKYGNKFPTMYAVGKYTGNDRKENWYRIVNSYYYN